MKVTSRAAAIAIAVALAAPLGVTAIAEPAAATPDAAAQALADATEADKAFAAATLRDGPAVSFLAWFEPEDSQFIAPGQVTKGAAAIAAGFAGSPPDFKISWTPDGGAGASSGDFAVTTGRYTIAADGQTIEAGRYLTTWRRNAEGVWKVIIDTTVADPAPKAPD